MAQYDQEALEAMLKSLDVMFSNASSQDKVNVQKQLEEFQKSVSAWQVCFSLLEGSYKLEAKVFAAQTIKSKINYDLHQLSLDQQENLKTALIDNLKKLASGNKLVANQLIVAVTSLAIRMSYWKDPVGTMAQLCVGSESLHNYLLQFLASIPQEIHDARKGFLTEDEMRKKEVELIQENTQNVIVSLQAYINQYGPNHSVIYDCLNSWITEIPMTTITDSPLLEMIFQALSVDSLFESAADLLISIVAETRDIETDVKIIEILYPKILQLENLIDHEDLDKFCRMTKIICETADSWVVLMARAPEQFLPLVDLVLKVCELDDSLDVIEYSFVFWINLRRFLSLEVYAKAREVYTKSYLQLANILISRLQYPGASDYATQDEKHDVFQDDREAEEKFRSFRHDMGDILKSCCNVVGYLDCLNLAFRKIKYWLDQKHSGVVLPWQIIEAPLFSLRAMAREVPVDEEVILPQLISNLVTISEHEKLQYAALLVLGRYTEWTANHPAYMTDQLTYIIANLNNSKSSTRLAAAQSFKHLCQDCRSLLSGQVDQLHDFYVRNFDRLDYESAWQVTEGVSAIVESQPTYENFIFCLERFLQVPLARIVNLMRKGSSEKDIAMNIENVAIFVQAIPSRNYENNDPERNHTQNEATVLESLMDLFDRILSQYRSSLMVCEKVCKCFKNILRRHKENSFSVLPRLAQVLVINFETTYYGCFLWISGCCVQEFRSFEGETRKALWAFIERLINSSLSHLSTVNCKDIPDVVEDFFRFLQDVVNHFLKEFTKSDLLNTCLRAAISCMAIEQPEPLWAIFHFLSDLFISGNEKNSLCYEYHELPNEVTRKSVVNLFCQNGQDITSTFFHGMIFSFPRNCISEALSMIKSMLELAPQESLFWINHSISNFSTETIAESEKQKVLFDLKSAVSEERFGFARDLIKQWTGNYRARVVTTRSNFGSGSFKR